MFDEIEITTERFSAKKQPKIQHFAQMGLLR